MDSPLTAKITVKQLLADHPHTVRVFLSLRMSCVGCHLARFCALKDVARVYNLSLDEFLQQLRESA